MQPNGALRSDEANDAAWAAGRGAVVGAAKWGIFGAILGCAGYAMSPIYRGLTVQFKVYLQMSSMILGGCLEADHRIRIYEAQMLQHKRMLRSRAAWEQDQEEYGSIADPKPKT